jgi:hypothetical protein
MATTKAHLPRAGPGRARRVGPCRGGHGSRASPLGGRGPAHGAGAGAGTGRPGPARAGAGRPAGVGGVGRRGRLGEGADDGAEVEGLVGGPGVAEVGGEGEAGRVEARVEEGVAHGAELQLLQRRRVVLVHLPRWTPDRGAFKYRMSLCM